MTIEQNSLGVSELARLLGTRQVILIDCRFSLTDPGAGRQAYEAGHLPGAVFLDLERDLSGPITRGRTGRHPLPDAALLAERLGAVGVSNDSLVVAYDDGSCMFAPRLWWLLKWLGHSGVCVLEGGLVAWTNQGHPLEQTSPSVKPTEFVAHANAGMLASVAEVQQLAVGSRKDGVLLDARGDVRYRGEQEPIDPVAGHIPRARNLPYTTLVNAGAPRPAAEVQASFRAAIQGYSTEQVVAYCGSGVTACALIWAAESAGLSGIRLYPGSWSEWITDSLRPVALGTE